MGGGKLYIKGVCISQHFFFKDTMMFCSGYEPGSILLIWQDPENKWILLFVYTYTCSQFNFNLVFNTHIYNTLFPQCVNIKNTLYIIFLLISKCYC